MLAVIPAGGILPVPKKRIIFRADLLRINNRFGDRPSVAAIIIAVTFSMAIGVSFGYYPAKKAAKMNPIDALRYE